MGIRLFPSQFLNDDACFGLFKASEGGVIELPVTLQVDAGVPVHIVHSDPDHLANLAGLIVLQAWVYGIDDPATPPKTRKPLLVITDSPGRFAEAYLRLRIPAEGVRRFCKTRRVALWKLLEHATNVKDKQEHWDKSLQPDDPRDTFHIFFPAAQLLHIDGHYKPIAGREHLARGDSGGPAVIIARAGKATKISRLVDRVGPFLMLIDADGVAVPKGEHNAPAIVYHDSVFSPELAHHRDDNLVICCMPDARFDTFCNQATLRVIDAQEPAELAELWTQLDSGLQSLIELVETSRHRMMLNVCNDVRRLRNVLMAIPTSVEAYELALGSTGLPESLWYPWSVRQTLQSLRGRIAEFAVHSDWAEYVLSETISLLERLCEAIKDGSPKSLAISQSFEESVALGNRMVILLKGAVIAQAMRWLVHWPPPYGLNLSRNHVAVQDLADSKKLEPDQCCLVPRAIDPCDLFGTLSRQPPRPIDLVLYKNELTFVGERFLRTMPFLPQQNAAAQLFEPLRRHIRHLPAINGLQPPPRQPQAFDDSEFERLMRLLEEQEDVRGMEVVLAEDSIDEIPTDGKIEARLVSLEGSRSVFLPEGVRITYIGENDELMRAPVGVLRSGERLVVIHPNARDFIAQRVIGDRKVNEEESPPMAIIQHWRSELRSGLEKRSLTNAELLSAIRDRGSERESVASVGQWVNGKVLGPQDAEDVLRIGEVIGSDWLTQNWKKVAAAMRILRGNHRVLGRRVTRILLSAAIGEFGLDEADEELLQQLDITFGLLQDAVTVLSVESVSDAVQSVPFDSIGIVIQQ